MTPICDLIEAILADGQEIGVALRAARIMEASVGQKTQSKHALAQARYYAKKKAEKSALISTDQHDHTDQKSSDMISTDRDIYSKNMHSKIMSSYSHIRHKKEDIYLTRFDEFWAHYPRKVSKKDAQAAWRAALRAGISPDLIVNSLNAYPFSADLAFVPHPATWLRKRRWEDNSAHVTPIFDKPKTQREALLDRLKAFADSPDEDQPQISRQLGASNGSAVPSNPNDHGDFFGGNGKPPN